MPVADPLAVRDLGISTVHQEFTLVRELSVTDNVFLGRERGRLGAALGGDAPRRRGTLLDGLGVHIDPAAPAGSLSVAHQQMVEIARALSTEARVLILDEPSATLSDVEVEILFDVLRRLRAQGLAILYVSHRLDEIFALADRVTVLRDGRLVETAPIASWTRQTLIRAMVGRDVAEEYPPRSPRLGAAVLEIEHLAAPPRFTDVSLTVRRGEIVGLAGLVGAGRTSVALAIIGALAVRAATCGSSGRPVRFESPAEAIAAGVGLRDRGPQAARHVPPACGTGENMTITHLASFARRGVLSLRAERAAAAAAAKRFDVRAASLAQPAGTLSGGNQQKALLARFVLEPRNAPKVLIIDEPTRGVDVGARVEIYRIMNELTAAGMAILMISSDLPEVLGMADRVVVMREGRTTGELARQEATAERVMALAAATGMTRWLSRYAIVAALVVECVILALATDSFFTAANLSNVLRQNAFTAILAAGMTFVILTAGIDLSVGSVVALSGRPVRRPPRARRAAAARGRRRPAGRAAHRRAERRRGDAAAGPGLHRDAGDDAGRAGGGVQVHRRADHLGAAGRLRGAQQRRGDGVDRRADLRGCPGSCSTRTPFGRHVYAVGGNESAAWLSGHPRGARAAGGVFDLRPRRRAWPACSSPRGSTPAIRGPASTTSSTRLPRWWSAAPACSAAAARSGARWPGRSSSAS